MLSVVLYHSELRALRALRALILKTDLEKNLKIGFQTQGLAGAQGADGCPYRRHSGTQTFNFVPLSVRVASSNPADRIA